MNRLPLTTWRRLAIALLVLLIAAAGLGLRLRATQLLPIDYDEDDYLGAAQRYAQFLAAGDLQGLVNYDYNYEHPPLTKLLYGVAILPLPAAPLLPEQSPTAPPAKSLPQPHFRTARTLAAVLGALEVLALAILQPLAGLLLAVHTWTIKYTSQVMLEPLPALTSLLTVLFYLKARRSQSRGRARRAAAWLILSAIALGLTASSKYMYCIVGVAIVVDAVGFALVARAQPKTTQTDDHPLRAVAFELLLWGLIAMAIFFITNPRLWSDPFSRLAQSLLYHGEYAQSAQVRRSNLPFWQPLVYLLGPVPWHPGVFLVTLDVFITVLAALGGSRLWREFRVCAYWLAIGLGFLLIWPTKWPQYILMITAPLSLAAGLGFQDAIWQPMRRTFHRRRTQAASAHVPDPGAAMARRLARRDTTRAWPWLAPGLLALSLLAIFPLIYQAAVALTDFNAISIRDGIQGGVWRAVWQGLTGQVQPVTLAIFDGATRAREVHWAGPAVLGQLLGGAVPDLVAFNLLWAVLSVSLQALLGVAAALMLHRRGVRWARFWRTIFILPWAIPEFVGALIWLRILEPDFGWLALAQGVPADALRAQAVAGPDATLLQLLVAATWYGFPLIMLAATAALKLTPDEVYDAAALDGAVGWQRFRWITWPLLLPLLAPALFVRGIFAFNQFYLFYTMRVEPPTITLATASYYLFSPTGYFGGQFAVSAAINLFTALVLLGLILWLARLTRGEVTEEVTYA